MRKKKIHKDPSFLVNSYLVKRTNGRLIGTLRALCAERRLENHGQYAINRPGVPILTR